MNAPAAASLDFILGRRSIRIFARADVTEASITKILEAAMAAPSAGAKDPWRFVVVREKTRLRAIADVLPFGKMLATASVGIVVCGDLEAAHAHELSYLLQDCSAAVENLLLATHALGLGACWLGVHPRADRVAAISKHLALPKSVVPIACVAIGHPGETKEPRTRFNAAFVHREKW